MRKLIVSLIVALVVAWIVGNSFIQAERQKAAKEQSFGGYSERVTDAERIEKALRASLDDPQHVPGVLPFEISNAHEKADSVPAGQPESERAKAVLARLAEDQQRAAAESQKVAAAKRADADAAARKAAQEAVKRIGPDVRRELAKTFEHEFLMRNMDARFIAEGKAATTLHFKYVLVGRPLAEQLKTDGEFLQRCRDVGFTFVILDDTFGNTFTFNL